MTTTAESLLKLGLAVVLVLVAAPLLAMAFMGVSMMGGWTMPGWMMEWNVVGGDGGVGLLMWIAMLVVPLLLLFLLLGLLWRALGGDSDRALEELRLAYARGDLTDEEYERRRERLGRT